MILTEIEKFVIQSLFERQLISEEKLCNAIKTLPDPDLLNEFLKTLITDKKEVNVEDTPKKSQQAEKLVLRGMANGAKLQAVKAVKEALSVNLQDAKDIVDNFPKEHTVLIVIKVIRDGQYKTCPVAELTKTEVDNISAFLRNGDVLYSWQTV